MSFWDILDVITDWLFNWRFNLCFWASAALAGFALVSIPYQTLGIVVAVIIVIAGVVTGLCWDRSD